jgi:hypothetical protein
MVHNVFDLSLDRTANEAVTFYIVHTVLMIIISSIAAFVLGHAGFFDGIDYSNMNRVSYLGMLIAFIYSLILSLKVIYQKNIMVGKYIFLSILGAFFALGAGVIGMLIPAYLTMKTKEDAYKDKR